MTTQEVSVQDALNALTDDQTVRTGEIVTLPTGRYRLVVGQKYPNGAGRAAVEAVEAKCPDCRVLEVPAGHIGTMAYSHAVGVQRL